MLLDALHRNDEIGLADIVAARARHAGGFEREIERPFPRCAGERLHGRLGGLRGQSVATAQDGFQNRAVASDTRASAAPGADGRPSQVAAMATCIPIVPA